MTFDAPIFIIQIVNRAGRVLPFPFKVQSFRFEDELRKVDKLTLTLDNGDLSAFGEDRRQFLAKGTVLSFRWGYPMLLSKERQAVIQKVTGVRQLTLEALGKKILAHGDTKARTWDAVKRSAVARELAEAMGYSDKLIDVEESEETLDHVVQAQQTDAQFLQRLADEEGWEFWIDAGGFHFKARPVADQPIAEYVYHLDRKGRVLDFVPKTEITALPAKVRVKTFDPNTKQVVDEVVSNDDLDDMPTTGGFVEMGYTGDPEQDALLAADLAMMEAGFVPVGAAEWESMQAQPTALEQPAVEVVAVIDGETGELTYQQKERPQVDEEMQRVSHERVFTMASGTVTQARAKAKRILAKARRESVKADLIVVGDPVIEAAHSIRLTVPAIPLFSKRYGVGKVTHEIAGFFKTTMEIDSDGLGRVPGKTKVQAKGQGWTDEELATWYADLEMLDAGLPLSDHYTDQAAYGPPSPPPLKAVKTIDPETGEWKTIFVEA